MLSLRRFWRKDGENRPGPDRQQVAGSARRFRPLGSPGSDQSRAAPLEEAGAFGGAFTPTRPRAFGPFFIGRKGYLQRLTAAVRDERAHIVLYGDRGVGKTSLANAFSELAKRSGYLVLRRSCGSSTTYQGLCRAILDAVPGWMLHRPATWNDARFSPEQVWEMLSGVRHGRVLVVIDEFDRIESDSLRRELAEALKTSSDHAAPVTFLIVGVAANLSELVGRHPSIQRNIVGMHLAPMSNVEIAELIETGAKAADIAFEATVADSIVALASGSPYYAHMLCLFAARSAAARGSASVSIADLQVATSDLIRAQDPELSELYDRLLAASPHAVSLFEAAIAISNRESGFTASEIGLPDADLAAFAADSADAPLRRIPAAMPRYRFAQPGFLHHIKLRAAARGRFPRESRV